MKKILFLISGLLLFLGFGAGTALAAPAPYWNTTGSYVISMDYLSVPYSHDMILAQDGSGNLTGNGGSPSGANTYTWVIDSGTVSGNSINFTAHYTATSDAVTPLTTLTMTGTIATDGTMSGTWSDNYQGGARTGTWTMTTGHALALGSLAAQDFGVMDVSGVKGYTSGFGLTDATLGDIATAVTQLYSGSTLLQTDTSIPALTPKLGIDYPTATQFSSPFDVFGTFDYVTDGYWANVRGSEYGQTLIPTKVIATVTLKNGKVLTAENDSLTGDPATIQPVVVANVTTNPATPFDTTTATLNGTNGPVNADNTSFWWGTTPIVGSLTAMADPTSEFPAGWSHDPGLGIASAGATFSEPLTGLTPSTTYYFVAWSQVGGIWYPGAVLSFITATPTACDANATQAIVSDATTMDVTDSHAAVAVTPNPAWTLSIPGATWIYSDPLDANGSSPTGVKTFSKTFTITGTPLDSSFQIAVDNMYTVSVNGHALVTGSSATDLNNFSVPQTWTIPAADLISGSNTITFTITNPAVDPITQVPFADPNPGGLLYLLTINNNECVTPQPIPSVTTNPATPFDTTTATLNGTNGPVNADNTSFWWGTTPIVGSLTAMADPTSEFPAGWSHDPGLGSALAGATFSEPLTGLTPSTTYYFVAWSQVGGIWYPGAVLSFTTATPVTPPLKVHILKYLDGAEATAVSANNYLFPMTATWNAVNIGAGTGNYVLGNSFGGATELYGADTADMSAPADYSTSEITSDIDSSSNVLSNSTDCQAGKYQLQGYTTSSLSFADAASKLPDVTAPALTGLTGDEYIIVWNNTCPTTGSLTVEKTTIGKDGTFTFTSNIPGGASFSITTTKNDGIQTFDDLAPGTYNVTETNVPKGWTMTDNGCSSVTISAGDGAICTITNTSNKLLGQIRGYKLEDRNGDGKLDHGFNRRLADWTIYIDSNNNGVLDSGEPSTVTDKSGAYRFTSLVAGTYTVREVGQTGWTQTVPSGGSYTINLKAGQIAKNKNFGNYHLGTISGMKYNDLNGNGRKDSNEPGLPGWVIDIKGPANFMAETTTDSNGNYSFTGLNAGMYTLTEQMQNGWRQTDHPNKINVQSGTNFTKALFGNTTLPPKTLGHGDNHGFPSGPFSFNFPNNFGHR